MIIHMLLLFLRVANEQSPFIGHKCPSCEGRWENAIEATLVLKKQPKQESLIGAKYGCSKWSTIYHAGAAQLGELTLW